jgi:GTP-binding protein
MATIVIVGRKNVGKSTIFNRLIGLRQSVVYHEPGVTRDRVYGEATWCGRTINIIDTGGFFPQETTDLARKIQEQISYGLKEADLIFFVVDGISGLQPGDEDIAGQLRKTNKPVILVINKVDSKKTAHVENEFAALGMDHCFRVSAEAGTGFGDLLDASLFYFPSDTRKQSSNVIRVLILGRPNSGKSTLLNVLTGSDRAIVDHAPGTTRDCVNARFSHDGRELEIIDTAGIRRPARVQRSIEFYSVLRAIHWIEHSDIILLLFDTTQGVVDQDRRIASLVLSKAKGLVFVPTKIDLIAKKAQNKIDPATYRSFPSFEFVPIIPISAHERTGIPTLLRTILDIDRESRRTLSADVLHAILKKLQPPDNGAVLNLRQIQVRPPVFRATVTASVKKSYMQYIRNTIRTFSSFQGVPILVRTKRVNGRSRRHVS